MIDQRDAALVLGAGGVVGSYLARELGNSGYEVTAIDRAEPLDLHEHLLASNENVTFQRMDIGEGDNLDGLLESSRPTVVYNLISAMQAQIDQSIIEGLWVTVDLCGQILDAAMRHDIPRVVTMSSRAVYGPPISSNSDDIRICRVTDRVSPVSSYARMKHLLEAMVEWYWGQSGGRYCAVRTAIQWGLREVKSGTRMFSLHNSMLEHALTGKHFEIATRGQEPSDLISFLDLARGLARAGASDGFERPVYNIGSGCTYVVDDFLSSLEDATGWTDYVIHSEDEFDTSLVSPTGLSYLLDIQDTMVDWQWFPSRSLAADMREFSQIWGELSEEQG